MSIEAVAAIAPEPALQVEGLAASTQPPPQLSFENVLGSLQTLNTELLSSQQATARLASGAPESLHHAVIGMEQTRLSFELMLAVRNKVLDAYQELMRMQV